MRSCVFSKIVRAVAVALPLTFNLFSTGCLAAATSLEVVIPKNEPCPCGSHAGGFDALYQGKQITINFEHSPTAANPVQHPVTVHQQDKLVKEWDSLICSMPGEGCPIAGKQVTVTGQWEDGSSFVAYHVTIQ